MQGLYVCRGYRQFYKGSGEIKLYTIGSQSACWDFERDYPLINCETDSFIMPALGRDDDVVSLFERNGIKLNIHFTTLENFATMAMIEKGLGMSVMNNLITEKWNCDVVKIPVDPPSRITLGLAVPSYKQASPAVKRFIKYAVERLKKIE